MSNFVHKHVLNVLNGVRVRELVTDGLFLFFVTVVVSLIFFDRYVAGDLCYYRSTYEAVKGLHIFDAFSVYRKHIFAADVLHFLFIWLFSNIVSHDVAMAFVNGGFAVLIYFFIRTNGVNRPLSIALVLSNYYFWVMAIPAERLKFGVVFAVLFYISRSVTPKLSFLFLGILSHASVAIFFIPFYAAVLFRQNSLLIPRSAFLRYFFSIVFLASILLVGRDIYEKIYNVAKGVNTEVLAIFPTLLMGALALWFTRQRPVTVVPVFAVIALLILFLSSDRLNMFSLFIALGYIVESKLPRRVSQYTCYDGKDVVLFLVSIFLFAKSLLFIANVYRSGSGFGPFENTCY